ncbi:MAG: ATP-binding protein [Egibacteraceae bacterium]
MARGCHRIYLGAAAGVGKTFAMLNEGWRRRERGTDVVVGFVETHGRAKTAEQVRDLEVIPRKRMTYRGTTFEEMDVDAVLARRPQVALVDEIAHTNVPGCRNAKRWQDVEELLDAGITVVSTLNIQHLESLNDVVERITGVKQRETIPDAVVRAAEQVELVDMTPEAIRRRMAHGNIYPPEKVDAALGNYFRFGNLGALRELALLWVADRVDEELHDYMAAHGIAEPWETRERVMVALTGAPTADLPIRRAARMANRTKAELLGVHVRPQDGLTAPASGDLERHQRLLSELGGVYREVVGDDIAQALLQFARAEHVTQIVLGSSRRSRWAELTRGSVINAVIRGSGGIDIHVISYQADTDDVAHRLAPKRQWPAALSARRRASGFGLALVGMPLLTVVFDQLRAELQLPSVLLLYLCASVVVATIGGFLPGVTAAVVGFLLANWYFTPPLYTFTIGEHDNLIALVVFVAVAGVVSGLADLSARRAAEAARARSESAALARLSSTLIDSPDPLPRLVADVRTTFGLDSVAILRRTGDSWVVESAAGSPVPHEPADGTDALSLGDDLMLVLTGPRTPADDRRILAAFAAQLALAVANRQLHEEAAESAGLAKSRELRQALLLAVSHDLRTPLASIKAWTTSLLQSDVDWSPEHTREILRSVVGEADWLNTLVGNLLDMSRLQIGAVEVATTAIGLEEIVPAALRSFGEDDRLTVDVPETLPPVAADPALLERVVANLVANALRWSPPDQPVRVHAGAVNDHVDLRVTDRGPGIPIADRDRVFQPFQRLGDQPNGSGIGLGLAVARGLTEAIDGTLTVEDTPGGGTTMVVSLKIATEPHGGGLVEPHGGELAEPHGGDPA